MFRLPEAAGRLLAPLAGWPRRTAALICLAIAAVSAVRPGPHGAPTAIGQLLVANRVLQPGVLLTADDLRSARWPATAVPTDALRQPEQAVGHRMAAALARGQPIQSGSLLEPAVADALRQGKVTTTVTLADQHQSAILANGAHIDLYGAVEDGQLTGSSIDGKPLARDVTVLAVLPAAGTTSAGSPGTLSLIVATDPTTASRIAAWLATPLIATLIPP
jgi:Flp pilus assembly protein CpaB